jgi:PAS domain-containing protein
MTHPIELILTRELAAHLSTPVFLVDLDGTLLYYNEPAEPLVGQRFDDTGPLKMSEWASSLVAVEEDGSPMVEHERPLVIAVRDKRPAYKRMLVIGLDGFKRLLEVTAIPLQGQGGRALGAVALFWEAGQE